MKINRCVDGKYSEIRLDNGKKVFLSVLPDRITASTMILFIPTHRIWEFIFPFYIRTAVGAWESSKDILRIVLHTIRDVRDLDDLNRTLEGETSKALREYIKEHGENARDVSFDKLGVHAVKQMLHPKDLLKIETIIHEYGKVIERVGQETMAKYPALVYPQSLLPYPREVIEKGLEDGLRYIDDEKMRASIRFCLGRLVAFIDDEEANRRNSEVLRHLGGGPSQPSKR